MRVNWYIESYEGGQGVLEASTDIKDQAVASITQELGFFVAHVYEHRFSSKRETKTDPSLIELMNWVEEELKFRESHE